MVSLEEATKKMFYRDVRLSRVEDVLPITFSCGPCLEMPATIVQCGDNTAHNPRLQAFQFSR